MTAFGQFVEAVEEVADNGTWWTRFTLTTMVERSAPCLEKSVDAIFLMT